MRGLSITLLPMSIAAALVLWGGERMARHEDVTRVPADRVRLLDFSAALRGELERIDGLYDGHIERIAARAPKLSQDDLAKECKGVAAIRQCHVFRKEKPLVADGTPPRRDEKVQEVQIEGGKRPFNPNEAVIIPKEPATSSGWITAPDRTHRVYWQIMGPGEFVAIVVDFVEIEERLHRHLAEWMTAPFSPLRESGEFVSVIGPDQLELASLANTSGRGPAALVIPSRIHLGEWQVQAWDRTQVVHGHDATTLASAVGIAAVLVLLGGILCVQQNRAIRLAEERVSFVNRVSHELGSPLTNILLNLDLATEAITRQPQQTETRLRLVTEEVLRLARLVSNVLTFSRSERRNLELRSQPCVPDDVIEGMLAQFQPSLDRRKIRVEWHRAAHENVSLDPDALAQITGNLISNVEKYAAAGGWLGLESRLANGRLRIRVSDHGPGIPAKHRGRIFEAFERVKQEINEGSSGTGLGLAIGRDLARRMGGDLVMIPSTDGAVFECDLPATAHLAIVKSDDPAA